MINVNRPITLLFLFCLPVVLVHQLLITININNKYTHENLNKTNIEWEQILAMEFNEKNNNKQTNRKTKKQIVVFKKTGV